MSSIYIAVICKSTINCLIYFTAANGNIIAFAIRFKIMGVVSIITSVYVVSYMTTLDSRVIFFSVANHIRAVDISDCTFYQLAMIIFSCCFAARTANTTTRTISD